MMDVFRTHPAICHGMGKTETQLFRISVENKGKGNLWMISSLSNMIRHLGHFNLSSLTVAEREAGFGILLSDVYASGALDPRQLESDSQQITAAVRQGNWEGMRQFRNDLVEQCRKKLRGAIPEILRTFSNESSPPKLALLKEEIIRSLWEADRYLILSGLREALESPDPEDPLATNAILIASWFANDMDKAVLKMWPHPEETTPPLLALRANLLLLLREIGLPSWITLEKLKRLDPAFGPNIDRILSEISQNGIRPEREIRAQFDDETVILYQAFSERIGKAALEKQSLNVDGFKRTRTSWIKPSFTWMLHRAGYGMKEAGQSRILAIRTQREVFEQLLREKESRVVQWDPERRVDLAALPYRTIQIGIRPEALSKYLGGIVSITDMTPTAHILYQLVRTGKVGEAEAHLPIENPYPIALRE